MEHDASNPVTGFAYATPGGEIIVNSVRETADATRLAGGEGNPFPVVITRAAVPRDELCVQEGCNAQADLQLCQQHYMALGESKQCDELLREAVAILYAISRTPRRDDLAEMNNAIMASNKFLDRARAQGFEVKS